MRCYDYYCYYDNHSIAIIINRILLLSIPHYCYYYYYYYYYHYYYYSPTKMTTIIAVFNLKLRMHICIYRLENVLCSKEYIYLGFPRRTAFDVCVVFLHYKNQYLLARLIMCCIYVNYYVICMRVT